MVATVATTAQNVPYLTLEEVAMVVGVTSGCVHQWIRKGKLKSEKCGKRYFVSGTDLAEFRKGYSRKNLFMDSQENIQTCLNCDAEECIPGSRICKLRGK